MFRSTKYRFDLSEISRKLKRQIDSGFSFRKLFIVLISLTIVFYFIPPIFRYFFGGKQITKDPLLRCMDDRLTPFFIQNLEFNANIRHVPPLPEDKNFIPYIGNGYIGAQVASNAHLNIKWGRSIQIPVYYHPFVSLAPSNGNFREATVAEYRNGIVHRFQCHEDYYASYEYYAHRSLPSILVQEMKFTNTRNQIIDVELVLPRISEWNSASTEDIRLQHGSAILEYQVITGSVDIKSSANNIIVVSIVTRKIPPTITLKKRGVTKLEVITAVHCSRPVHRSKFAEVRVENDQHAVEIMKKALQKVEHEESSNLNNKFKREHVSVWNALWSTGFSISTSKAENSINGDRINATIYGALSHLRSFESEEDITLEKKLDIARSLTYSEGCYDSYHTLQADNLWLDMGSLEDMNHLIDSWMLTLEKQGCHNLIRAGASGAIQAMVLSFGSFRFSNQHLEFNIHPKFLHRDYHFRRLNYGNMTHVNITVSVTDDNKAVIDVALDRSDRSYYACDGGCLDEPILLTQGKRTFPVKLTDPLTSILYITADKQHMEDLHKAIHVKEVAEAPAHEHHVIALHRHGHHLGGLPTLFWVSVVAIIIVFHVFLCKLIVKEYCEPPDKMRYRYNKP